MDFFASCKTPEERYGRLIEAGRQAAPLPPDQKTKENLVPGCQSTMYLYSELIDNKMIYRTEADALISAGLGILACQLFSGKSPEEVLQSNPEILNELGLSPSRSNGLASLVTLIKQRALNHLVGITD